jgi:hypothetical protein
LPIGGGGFFPGGFTGTSFADALRRLPGGGSGGPRPGIAGAAPGGGLGAEKLGGLGAERPVSPGSERYDESAVAPVSIPARVFFSLGMPPAKRPASCGAASMPAAGAGGWPAP